MLSDFGKELLGKLIEHLELEEIETDEITDETELFGDGLELDSIDVIEIEVMVKKEYNLNILPSERNNTVYGSVGALAAFVQENKNRDQ